jgi:hypothetical protein
MAWHRGAHAGPLAARSPPPDQQHGVARARSPETPGRRSRQREDRRDLAHSPSKATRMGVHRSGTTTVRQRPSSRRRWWPLLRWRRQLLRWPLLDEEEGGGAAWWSGGDGAEWGGKNGRAWAWRSTVLKGCGDGERREGGVDPELGSRHATEETGGAQPVGGGGWQRPATGGRRRCALAQDRGTPVPHGTCIH